MSILEFVVYAARVRGRHVVGSGYKTLGARTASEGVALGAWFGWGLDDEKGRGDMRRG
jgi:hypothetical protein